jgi:hypothetical protein
VLFLDNIDGLLANNETGFTDFLDQVVDKLRETEENACHQGRVMDIYISVCKVEYITFRIGVNYWLIPGITYNHVLPMYIIMYWQQHCEKGTCL